MENVYLFATVHAFSDHFIDGYKKLTLEHGHIWRSSTSITLRNVANIYQLVLDHQHRYIDVFWEIMDIGTCRRILFEQLGMNKLAVDQMQCRVELRLVIFSSPYDSTLGLGWDIASCKFWLSHRLLLDFSPGAGFSYLSIWECVG